MTEIFVKNLKKCFGNVIAVDDISFTVKPGEFITLLGPSGCGKTTTLRCIGGLEIPDNGEIWMEKELMFSEKRSVFVAPEKRNLGMVFQSYAIWPHMTIFDNIAYGLKIRKVPRKEIETKVKETLRLVRLEGLEKRNATLLSGGQQQRVALARSIILEPKALLFDEPLSNLDAQLRERVRFELKSLQKKLGITSIYVTHDQAEAMAISDRIIVMNKGKIVQVGKCTDLYERPKNEFIANFIGLANTLPAKTLKKNAKENLVLVETDDNIVLYAEPASLDSKRVKEGVKVTVIIRPERIGVHKNIVKGENVFKGEIIRAVYLGGLTNYYIRVKSTTIRAETTQRLSLHEGESCYIHVKPCNVLLIA